MVPIEIDPDAAREAAANELADPAYQAAEPSLLDRFFAWLGRWFADLLSTLGGGSGSIGLLVLVLLGIVVFVVIRARVGRVARTTRKPVFHDGSTQTAVDYRKAAEDARMRGDLNTAVRERFRAIVRELEVRGVLDERSGRTVDECAAQAGRRLPDRAGELRAAATVFDDVVYGGRDATEAAYLDLTTLDDGIRTVAAR
jgi:hypothetical protein